MTPDERAAAVRGAIERWSPPRPEPGYGEAAFPGAVTGGAGRRWHEHDAGPVKLVRVVDHRAVDQFEDEPVQPIDLDALQAPGAAS